MSARFSMVIANTPIDIFQDEVVQLIRQVKDVTDLSQARTDFTQQFTIPSTPTNDGVFSNYFEENIVLGNWNAYLKLDATIFIHGLPVFVGCVELSGVKYANGLARQYDIIFYGSAKNAMALFGEDTLIDVNWDSLEHIVDSANIESSWNQTLLSGDVLYPIIDWHVGYTYSRSFQIVNNIAKNDVGGVQINDLRPLIRIRKMIELCFANIGYTLTGTLLDRPEFEDWYVAPMGVAGPVQNYTNEQAKIEVKRTTLTIPSGSYPWRGSIKFPYDTEVSDPLNLFNTTTREYTVPYNGNYKIKLTWNINTINSGGLYGNPLRFSPTINGNPSIVGDSINTTGLHTREYIINLNQNDKLAIAIGWEFGGVLGECKFEVIEVPYGIANTTLNLKWVMPTTKVVDFVRSFMQMTNSILIPVNDTTFEIHNIEDWYANANTKDWTKYIDVAEISHQKMDIPKSIKMTHAEGLDLANQEIISKYSRRFGMIDFAPNVDFARDEFNVETIFNIPVPSIMREVNDVGNVIGLTDLQIPVMLDKDGKPVQHNLMMFMYAGYLAINNHFYFNGTPQTFMAFVGPYNGVPTAKTSYSLSYGLENALSGNMALNTLFKLYYQNYLSRYYSTKSRLVTMNAIIPVGEWLNLDLNDTIAVSGNYYKIQKIQYDILNERASIDFVTYNNVTTIALDSDGNTADWTDATSDPSNGATLIGNAIVGRSLTNSRPFDAINYVGIPQQTSYNAQNVGEMKTITNQLFNRFRKTVLTAYNNTPYGTSTTGDTPVWVDFEQSELIGQDRMVFSAIDNWLYDEYGGQFRLTATLSFAVTSDRHIGMAIYVDGQRTQAYSCVYHSNGAITVTSVLNIGAEQKVQLAFWNEDNENHAITIHNARLISELL